MHLPSQFPQTTWSRGVWIIYTGYGWEANSTFCWMWWFKEDTWNSDLPENKREGNFFFFAFFDPMKDTLSGIPFNVSKSFWCIIGTTNNLSPTGKMEPQKGISQLSAWTNAKGSWFGALFGGDRKNSLKFKRTGSMFHHLQTVWPRTRLIISRTQTVGRTISFSHWVPTL